ncbi:MAG: rhomboid family intramembrane serine protease [Candidatus Bathyarchaeota archaeon]|nr:rhomboid family intramembrane serine protease [Candidatus Bathyarchaeota archaeon]
MGDATRTQKRPIATLVIIGINIAVYAITSYTSFFLEVSDYWVSAGGFVPSLITMPSQWFRVFTSMFLHADFFHILFNMYFLYLFGRAVENVLGGIKYLALYFISGIVASIFHTAFSFLGGFSAYVIPAIGASGAISGVLGAYLILYPGTSLVMGWFFFLFPMFFRMKAAYYLIFWFATQLIYGYARLAESTAVFAHAGGFIAGIALLPLLAKKERISQLKLMRKIALPPYLTFLPRKTVGLGQITKAIVAVLLSSLLFGAAYASVGLTNQGNIKSATIQYTCEGTPYMDYVGLQLSESIESQLASISLDQTRILLSRLYYVKLLYDKAKIDENVSLNTVSITLQVGVGRQNFPVKLIIDYFEGRYDGDGFLSYGEGNLTTEVVFIYQYEIKIGNSSYNFYLSSQTVNLTDITQYTGFPSFFVAVIALAVVFKKDKDLAVVGEESETFWRRFEPII